MTQVESPGDSDGGDDDADDADDVTNREAERGIEDVEFWAGWLAGRGQGRLR